MITIIEPAKKDAVNIDKPIVVVDAAVPIPGQPRGPERAEHNKNNSVDSGDDSAFPLSSERFFASIM